MIFVLQMMNSVLQMMILVFKMMNSVLKVMRFVFKMANLDRLTTVGECTGAARAHVWYNRYRLIWRGRHCRGEGLSTESRCAICSPESSPESSPFCVMVAGVPSAEADSLWRKLLEQVCIQNDEFVFKMMTFVFKMIGFTLQMMNSIQTLRSSGTILGESDGWE